LNKNDLLFNETANFVHVYQAPHTDRPYLVRNNELFEPGKDIENN